MALGIPKLKSCCCGCSLKSGTLIIGGIHLAFSLVLTIVAIVIVVLASGLVDADPDSWLVRAIVTALEEQGVEVEGVVWYPVLYLGGLARVGCISSLTFGYFNHSYRLRPSGDWNHLHYHRILPHPWCEEGKWG